MIIKRKTKLCLAVIIFPWHWVYLRYPIRLTRWKRQDVTEIVDHFFEKLAARSGNFGKLLAPGERPHRRKNSAAIAVIARRSFLRRHARIKRSTPTAVDGLDIGIWIHPRHHRPQNFLEISRVNVLVYDNDVSAVTRGGGAGKHCMGRLPGMARIALPDGDRTEIIR